MGYGRQYTIEEIEAEVLKMASEKGISENSEAMKAIAKAVAKEAEKTYREIEKMIHEGGPVTVPIENNDSYRYYVVHGRGTTPPVNVEPKGCDHDMKEYVGLFETDRYCTKCPYKERT